MLWVLIKIASPRNKQNYPIIITKYPPYLFHCIAGSRAEQKCKVPVDHITSREHNWNARTVVKTCSYAPINVFPLRRSCGITPRNLKICWQIRYPRVNKKIVSKIPWMCLKICSLFEPPHDKTNQMTVCPVKTQISLGIRPVWSESSLSVWRKLGSLLIERTVMILIRLAKCPGWSVFAGRTCHFVGFNMRQLICS